MRISDWSSDVCSSDLVEATQDVVEETVHLAVKRLQRMSVTVLFGADRDRQPVFLPAPGNEITKSHDKHLLSGWILSIHAGNRSAERRVGKECCRTWRSRWLPNH